MPTLRHYAILKAVSETHNFTKAAEKLYITQSAVSHAVKELEEYTGSMLFDRLPKQARLTSAGRLLLAEALPILAACEALDKRIGQLEKKAPIHIVSSITIAAFVLPRILKRFEGLLPDVPVYVNVVSAANALRILQEGGADIAYIEGPKPAGQFICTLFDDYTLKAVCAPHYPLPSAEMAIDEFCSQKLLLRETGSAIRDILDSRLFLLGYTVYPLWTSVNSTALLEAAKAGLGITVLPEVLIREEIKKKTLMPLQIKGLTLKNDMYTVIHKDKNVTPSLQNLLSCTKQ